ncbi:MAG: helix-hairpin-helix domain-containing protein, partial [bacterium]
MVERGEDLSDIPNIGKSTADKIHEILERGTCKRLEDLRKDIPESLTELLNVPDLGPRKVMELHRELDIDSLEDLKKACEDHKVRELEGMGEKTEEKILQGIGMVERTAGRILYKEAADYLGSLAKHLDSLSELARWEVAGSFRRGRETIGDLDILVHAQDRKKAADAILGYESIADVLSRGEERISVRLDRDLRVDFRFFEPSAFGAAWLYFTGSKSHNIRVRRVAQDNDWKLNEYGLFKGEHLLAGKTEKAVYSRLGMRWVPPEMREDRGEVEAARGGRLPRLIETDDIRGDFQCHTTASDGNNSIEEMAKAARGIG